MRVFGNATLPLGVFIHQSLHRLLTRFHPICALAWHIYPCSFYLIIIMGNIIQNLCCKDSPTEIDDDEREEQSRIWTENGNNNQQYGACTPPSPPIIYQIVLPKLIPVDIADTSINTTITTTSTTTTSANKILDVDDDNNDGDDGDDDDQKEEEQDSEQQQQQPVVIKEEYCAEQFKYLRSLTLKSSEGQNRFLELLLSCIPWAAPSGKSGSTFMRTVNDQFILKEMSNFELQSFLSISDEYFEYIKKSYHDDRPSLLSTILGIYRIVYTNSGTQSSSEYYFMVMNNLFYKRNILQRFDLKGSMRNRLVHTSDSDNNDGGVVVLMDENLVKITCENPLLIREKSKQILNEAIDNDSKFLTSISVMDYSLLVGVDKENKELVLGIIDYVRPFTWDKKVERVVKSVVSKELPTIIEPELYRERFCEAMNNYFESVPDDW